MAWTALIKADLLALSKSWVLRGWLIALAATQFFGLMMAVMGNRMQPVPASTVVSGALLGFLLVWSAVIVVLSAGSISLEADIVSDSVLSRSCTRTQYITAKLAARLLVVLAIYAVVAVVVSYVAWRWTAADVSIATLATGAGIVAMAVALLVTLGVAMSAVLNNTIVAVVGLLLLWYVANPVFAFVGAQYLSPASLARNLPRILKSPTLPEVVEASATPTSVTVVFSHALDPVRAERPENYQVEVGEQPVMAQTATYDKSRTSVVLAGLHLEPGAEGKVTARGVTDRGGNPISLVADSASFRVPVDTAAGASSSASSSQPTPAARTSTTRGGSAADRTAPRVLGLSATPSSLRVQFSEDLDRASAESPENYLVENPPREQKSARLATYTPSARSVLLTGLTLDLESAVTVTVRDVKDKAGNTVAPGGSRATYTEITTWKYLLGFGVPALVAGLLSVVWFARRDL